MKKKLFLMVMLALVLVCGMAVIGCINAPNEDGSIPSELVGIWRPSNPMYTAYTLEFRSNGELLVGGAGGSTASVSGNTVTVKQGGIQVGTFDYSINGSQMTIMNETARVRLAVMSPYNKQ